KYIKNIPMSKLIPVKSHMSNKEGNYSYPTRMSEHSRVQRLKLTPNDRLNNNYPLSANMLIYSSQKSFHQSNGGGK
ncbi:16959_t:CDS:1, partial [Funneliformis geosporum]